MNIEDAISILNRAYTLNIKKLNEGEIQNYIRDKYMHSFSTLCTGKNILKGECEIELQYALLLHDIGRFFAKTAKQQKIHAELGYQYLKSLSIGDQKILLPIRYHENDMDWKDLLHADENYICLSRKEKKIVEYYCTLVKDSDIIANMYEVKKKYPDSGIYPFSNTLKKKFLNRLLPEQEEVIFPGDTILYMLCGLSLITLEESHQYIKQTQIARDLAKRLKSKLIMEKLKELYDM